MANISNILTGDGRIEILDKVEKICRPYRNNNCKNMRIKSHMGNKVSAVNQAIKACAMARGFLATKGYDLVVAPGFSTTEIDGEEKTTIRLVLKLL